MKVAVIGAGFTGLAAATELADRGVEVHIFEKEDQAGGLASGFKEKGWRWCLEYYYHHVFTNDTDILEIAKKVGLPAKIYSPKTCSFINGKLLQLDSPVSVIKFSEISFLARVWMGIGLAILKLIPDGLFLEKYKTVEFLPVLIGREGYTKIWERLLRAKFGTKVSEVNMAWFWSRVSKRTKNLGYFDGGFGALAKKMQKYVEKRGGRFYFKKELDLGKKNTDKYQKIIVTTPGPIADKIAGEKIMPQIDYLFAQTLVLELKYSLIDCYWLNILEREWPFLVAVEHTNLVDKDNFGGRTIVYLGNYLESDSWQLKLSKTEVEKIYFEFLKKINPEFRKEWVTRSHLFRAPFAQPVFPINYSRQLNRLKKSKGKYLFANMSMVYPFDRGTNYAIKLGIETAKKCL